MAAMRVVAAFAGLAVLAGCASVSNIPLTPAAGGGLKDREITLAVRDKPDFYASRPALVVLGGGLIAAAIMISEGNRIVAENQIEDPAYAISRALSANLEQAWQARPTTRTALLKGDDVAPAARADADLILDVQTTRWSFHYFPAAFTRYRVMYTARLRIIDAKRSQVVAEGSCKRIPDETPDAPTFDELMADRAARLKRELEAAAEYCVRVFSTETLAIARPAVTVASLAGAPAAAKAPAAAPLGTPPLGNEPREVAVVPASVAVAPASNLKATPPGAAPAPTAFSGAWTGRWKDGPRATVTVEQIEGRGAQLVYTFSAGNRRRPSAADGVHGRASATFDDDGALRATLVNGARVVYRLSGEDSLQGEYMGKGVRYEGEFKRR